MGIANRIASKLSAVVCVAFPNLLKKSLPAEAGQKYRMTGNPIRPEIAEGNTKKGYKLTGFSENLPVLLVWGGSQGAAEINEIIESDFENFTREFQIVHITGAGPPGRTSVRTGKSIEKQSPNYVRFEYLGEELKHIYAITNMVIGRAGANSLYELAYLQKPNIIIPLGNADQLNNAHYFGEKGASIVYKKGDHRHGAASTLFDLAHNLWQNGALQEEMKKSLADISGKGANEEIVKIILDL